CQHYSDWPYSS
nr:immunoglobulin light chain junction region [Macaca mulatta]